MAEHISHEPDSDMEYELDLESFYDFDYDAFVSKFSDVDVKPRITKRQTQGHVTQPSPMRGCQPAPTSNVHIKPTAVLAEPKKEQPLQLERFPDEVLSNIFSNLPQATLRTNASLVCRSWARVCQFMVRRVGVWKTMGEDGHQGLLNQMPKINTLVCWILQDPELQPQYWSSIDPKSTLKMWNRFVRDITKPLPSKALAKGTDCLLHHIKEIVIHGDYISYKRVIAPLLPHLKYLRILRLDFQQDDSSMELFPILHHCLNLKELTVKGAINKFLTIHADSDDQGLTCAEVPDPPPKEELESYIHSNRPTLSYPQQYGILCIIFHEVIISQHTLERIVVTCPLLRTLKVTEMKKYRPVPDQPGILKPVHLDRGRITRLVREYCSHMEWLTLLQSLEPEQVWTTTLRPVSQHDGPQPPATLPSASYEWFKAKATRYLSLSKDALNWDMLDKPVSHISRSILSHLRILEVTDNWAPQWVDFLGMLLTRSYCLEHFRAPRAQFMVPWNTDWGCYMLQSIDVGLSGPAPSISGLFRAVHCPALREVCIRCESVYLGQLVSYPEHAGAASSKESRGVSAWQKRFPDFLEGICVLRQLETLKIYTDVIPGIVTGSEFEYLRQPQDNGGGLPHLASMVFVYRSSPMKDDYRDVVAALELIRPAVEFRFIERSTKDEAL